MKVIFIVHGIVQGVGYRNFVMTVAKKHGITGIVRNIPDGSVEIIASGKETKLLDFEKDIQVSEKHGIQVMNIEKIAESDPMFPKDLSLPGDDFLIGK